jgi:flagellar biosynthetic protein FliP
MSKANVQLFSLLGMIFVLLFLASAPLFAQESGAFGITFQTGSETPGEVSPAIKIVSLLTILSVAPAILLMMTSFTRIVIVLGFIRLALGTQTMPPNQVIIGLSLFLTFFTMSPILDEIKVKALDPYIAQQIDGEIALTSAMAPVRSFMLSQTRQSDLGLFYKIAGIDKPFQPSDIPNSILLPAFMISELKTAFNIGFIIYIPFLVIDMVISSILMAMGMMMLPPTVVSLPFKLVLFVLVDGWALIVNSLMDSFHLIF